MYVKSEIKNKTKQLLQRGASKNHKFMQEISKPLWIPGHFTSGLKQSHIASRILIFYPAVLAPPLYFTITFFFFFFLSKRRKDGEKGVCVQTELFVYSTFEVYSILLYSCFKVY